MKDESEEWTEELEKMKSINFFPYAFKDPKEVKKEINKETCTNHNCCGNC